MIRAGLAVLFVAQLLAVALLIGGDSGNVVVLVPPTIVAAPPPPPPAPPPTPPAKVEPPAKPVCPAPVGDVHVARIGQVDEAIDHVHPSRTNAHWIAAWNDDHIYVSRDGGATFDRVLDGPGTVTDVGFDCFGDPIALRGAQVGTIVDADEQWRAIPGLAGTSRVLDGGPDIAIVGAPTDAEYPTKLAVSSDHGVAWRFRDLDRAYEASNPHGRQAADGTIDVAVAIADCDYYGIVWATWRASGEYVQRTLSVSGTRALGLYDGVLLDDGQWAHDDGTWRAIASLPEAASMLEGPWPAELGEGGVAYRIRGGKATKLPYCVDGREPSIDAAGRVWMIDADHHPAIAGPMHDGCQLAPEPDYD